jgi:hypothetical protein
MQGTAHEARRSTLTISDKITLCGLGIGIITVVVALTTPEIRLWLGLDKKSNDTHQTNPEARPVPVETPPKDTPFGEKTAKPAQLSSPMPAWSTAVEGNDYSEGGVGTSILVWPKAPMKFPATLRIFYTADLLGKPQPTFEGSTGQKVDVADWSTARNGLTFTIRKAKIDENNPVRIRVYSTTQLGVVTIACPSCP